MRFGDERDVARARAALGERASRYEIGQRIGAVADQAAHPRPDPTVPGLVGAEIERAVLGEVDAVARVGGRRNLPA